jgi:hypothetical protein
MKMAVPMIVATLLLGAAPAPPPVAPAEPLNCYSCLVMFFDGVPIAAWCLRGGATMGDCAALGPNCYGQTCGWAAAEPTLPRSSQIRLRRYSGHSPGIPGL